VAAIYTNALVLREEGRPVRMVGASVDITERKRTERQRDLLVAELSHRVKNTLATVISIARQSFPRTPELDAARQSFEGRLRAMAQTHSRLAEVNWSGVPLETLLRDELTPYRGDGLERVQMAGPSIFLTPKLAVMLGMGFHELATNAAKYGALSTPTGSVEASWTVGGGELAISWRETGGPAVTQPARTGFGRLLLEKALAADIAGRVSLDFGRSGLACTIALPYSGGQFG
jgi:two-component sensor histidine kinase